MSSLVAAASSAVDAKRRLKEHLAAGSRCYDLVIIALADLRD
jgi:hypothetical protein